MLLGINIDDKEVKKNPLFYINFLSKIMKHYPTISFIELTYTSFEWAYPYNKNKAKETIAILKDYPFSYSIHFPEAINFLKQKNNVIDQCIEFSIEISSNNLVIHSINDSIPGLLNDQEINKINIKQMEEEFNYLSILLNQLSKLAINLHIENSLAKMKINSYSYSINPMLLAEQVKKFKNENIYICLDWGHAYLSSETLGINFKKLINEIHSYVNHMHLHNNYGIIGKNLKNIIHKHPNGDYHLPIYQGRIRFNDFSFILKKNFDGFWVISSAEATISNLI